jgi:hypothetical protein
LHILPEIQCHQDVSHIWALNQLPMLKHGTQIYHFKSMLPPNYLEKFKKLYFTKFNIELNDEEATEQATALLNLMRVLIKPDNK